MQNKLSFILKNRNGTTITLKDFEPLIVVIVVFVFMFAWWLLFIK